MSLLRAGPDWQARTGRRGWRSSHFTSWPAVIPESLAPFLEVSAHLSLPHLGILAGGWDFLCLGCPVPACLRCSYPCQVSTLEQHRKRCAVLPSSMSSTSRKHLGGSLSYHLAGCTDPRKKGDAEAAEARAASPELAAAALLPELCLRG